MEIEIIIVFIMTSGPILITEIKNKRREGSLLKYNNNIKKKHFKINK